MSDETKDRIEWWQNKILGWVVVTLLGLTTWVINNESKAIRLQVEVMRGDVEKLREGQGDLSQKIVEMNWIQEQLRDSRVEIKSLESRLRSLENNRS